VEEQEKQQSQVNQLYCIPLSPNVKQYDFSKLREAQMKYAGQHFDVITVDPPWELFSKNSTEGVPIANDQLNDLLISSLLPFL